MPIEKDEENLVLSISIVTYKIEKEAFSTVLLSLNKAISKLFESYGAQVQVTVIDNDDQKALLQNILSSFQETYVDYKLISGQGNIGYGRANNLAIRTTSAEYHLILNPDVILEEDCLIEGLRYLNNIEVGNHKEPSAISPRVIDDGGEMAYLCKRYPCILNFLLRGFAPQRVKRFFKKRLNYYELRDKIKVETTDVVEDIPLISGCFMLCRTKALHLVGGFDERIFLHFEDMALSMELRKIGALHYVPAMKIQHFGGNSARKGLKHIFIFVSSGIKFFNIYGWKLI